VLYKLVECPYCEEVVHVLASSFESQLPIRVNVHLQNCAEYPYSVPRLPGSRSLRLERKPYGKQRTLSQLYIDNHGTLQKHEFGSLLRCNAPSKRARDTIAVKLPISKASGAGDEDCHDWDEVMKSMSTNS
jgi:hypothetical protein